MKIPDNPRILAHLIALVCHQRQKRAKPLQETVIVSAGIRQKKGVCASMALRVQFCFGIPADLLMG